MRPYRLVRLAGFAVVWPAVALAQPRKYYRWGPESNPDHGKIVLDASMGGGTANQQQLGGSFILFVNPDQSLNAQGNNHWGQLGWAPTAYAEPCDVNPSLCRTLPIFGGSPPTITTWKLRMVRAGWDHGLGLADDAALAGTKGLVAWGLNDKGQAEIPNLWASPWHIISTANVQKISAGEFINIVLFDNGQIAAWGDNRYGVDPRSAGPLGYPFTPYQPDLNWRFKDVVAGGHFVMALIKDAPGSGLPTDPNTGRVGEGWIVSWGSWDYSDDTNRAPGYRGYVNGNPVVPSPLSSNGAVPQPYTPPYDKLFASHVSGGGIILNPTPSQTSAGIRAGTVHIWGQNIGNVITELNPNWTWEQVQGGYYGFICGVAKDDWTGVVPPNPGLPLHRLESWGLVAPGGFPTPSVLGFFELLPGPNVIGNQTALCYSPNCDGSTTQPILTANDMICFANRWAEATNVDPATGPVLTLEQQRVHYCNCDGSTTLPSLTANDWMCFLNAYARGACP